MRSTRLSKALVCLLLVVAMAIGLLGAARYYLTSSHATKQIAEKLQGVLGVPVRIDQADVGIRDGSSLQGVQIFEDGNQRPDKPWLTVQEVRVDLTALDVVGGESSPKRIVLSGAAIELRFDEDGHLLTGLPSLKPTAGQPFPELVLEGSQLTLAQEGRPPMVIKGLNAVARDHDGALAFDGTIHDDYWGKWTVEGSFATADGKIDLKLKTPQTTITQKKLESLPFVSESTWKQVKFNGVSPVDFEVSFSLRDKGVHYRVDLIPDNSQVEVTSIALKADHASGKVTVADRIVTLRDVHGQTASGAIDLPKADLDFSKTPYDLTFDVSVRKVNLQELPKSWKIPEPPFVEGPMLLTGRADLRVQIQENKATTTGDGNGIVDTVVFKKPTQVEVRLKADEKGFHFSTPAKTALKLLPLLAPPLHVQEDPQESAPDEQPKGPHPLAVPLGQGTEAMTKGTGALLKGGARALGQVSRWLKPLPPGEKTGYLEANLALKNVDVEEIVRDLKAKPPFAMSGKVSFQVQVAVPIDTPNDTRAYKLHGSATSARLVVAGVEMTDLSAKVNYDNGVLTLQELNGRFAETAGSFDGGGKLQFDPLGDLKLSLHVEKVSLQRVLELLPGAENRGDGTLSGRVDARVPAKRLRDPLAWEAGGKFTSERLAVYGLALKQLSLGLSVKEGTATVHDLTGELESGKVSGDLAVRWADGYPYKGSLALKDADLAALQHLSPNLRPTLAVEGRAGIIANFQGKLAPFAFSASGTAEVKDLAIADVQIDELTFRWEQDANRIKLTEASAQLYGGTVSGSATIPLKETNSGDARLKLDKVDFQKLAKATSLVPFKLEGPVSGTVMGSLSAAAPGKLRELTTQIELTAPTLRVEGVRTENLHGNVNYRGGGADYHLDGEALGGRFELDGKLPPPPAPQDKAPQGRLRFQGMRLSKLGAALHMRESLEPLSGNFELDLPFRYEGPQRTPVGDGRFSVRDVRWAGNEMAERIEGDVQLSGSELKLRHMTGSLGEGTLRGTVVFPLKPEARSWYNLQLERVEAARLLLPFTGTAPSPTSEPVGGNPVPVQGPLDIAIRGNLGNEWRGTGTIALLRGKVYGLDVSEWRLPISLTFTPSQGTGQLDLTENNALFAQGRAQGRATLHWGEGLRLDGSLRFFEVNVPTLLRSAGGASKIVGGRMSGRLDFAGENIRSANDLNATLDASFTQAQALQLPVLDVLARWVAPGQSAMTFDRGDVRATLSRGIVRVKRLSMSNATLRMLVEGTVTLQGRLDLEATASTGLLGIDPNALRLLGVSIPAVGPIPVSTILTASSFLSNRVLHLRVTGTVKEPSVQLDPVRLLTDEAIRFFLGAAVGVPTP